MKDADTTWALVVAIDVYDNVTPLKGPVRDAVAVVGWLRRLGVADDRILLHASPCTESEDPLKELGLAPLGCTQPEIWASLAKLLQHDGARLFVFLLGHGYFLFDGGCVFLTKEANTQAAVNYGIEWLADLLRARNYQRQFILMDGCLNYAYNASQRPTITPGGYSGVMPGPAQAGVSQWFGYAASQGETAAEPNGRGIFTETLLATLDLTAPDPSCTTIDDTNGNYELDLDRAIADVVSQAVSQQIPTQRPGIRRLDTGPGTSRAIVATITPAQTVALRTIVDPAAAAVDVDYLTLTSQRFQWNRKLPYPEGSALTLPSTSVLPTGMKLVGWCEMKPHSDWSDPDVVKVTSGSGADVVFTLKKDRSAQAVKVTTVGADDAAVAAMNADAVNAAASVIASTGAQDDLWLAPSRTGATVFATIGEEEQLGAVSQQIAAAIDRNTPDDVHTTVELHRLPFDEPKWHGWMLDIDLSPEKARALGGFMANHDVVRIGEASMSLLNLARLRRVAIDGLGPVRVELELPWGRWTTIIEPPDATTEAPPPTLTFPNFVGLPPVRNGLPADIARPRSDGTRRMVDSFALAVRTNEPIQLHVGGGKLARRLLQGHDNTRGWTPLSARNDAATPASPRLFSGDELEGIDWPLGRLDVQSNEAPLYFPMYGPLLAFDDQIAPRIEPLSATNSPLWDLLVSAGRLDALDTSNTPELTRARTPPLLRIAGMYGSYVNGFDELLAALLRGFHLAGPTDEIASALPDLVILRHAYAMRFADRISGDVMAEFTDPAQLKAFASDARVPMFKWGFDIGRAVARHFDVPALVRKLQRVEDRLMTASTWTLWHGQAVK